jgi:hypothetical protein
VANIENVRKVLDLVRDERNFFSMKQFAVHPDYLVCLDDRQFLKSFGSPKPTVAGAACIAGWTNHAAGNNLKDERAAAEFLGLPFPAVSDKLFRPRLERHKDAKYDLSAVTRAEAVVALENLIATSTVDWEPAAD